MGPWDSWDPVTETQRESPSRTPGRTEDCPSGKSRPGPPPPPFPGVPWSRLYAPVVTQGLPTRRSRGAGAEPRPREDRGQYPAPNAEGGVPTRAESGLPSRIHRPGPSSRDPREVEVRDRG